MKEFDHPIDYALESALPRLQAWGLVTVNSQVRCMTVYDLTVLQRNAHLNSSYALVTVYLL